LRGLRAVSEADKGKGPLRCKSHDFSGLRPDEQAWIIEKELKNSNKYQDYSGPMAARISKL